MAGKRKAAPAVAMPAVKRYKKTMQMPPLVEFTQEVMCFLPWFRQVVWNMYLGGEEVLMIRAHLNQGGARKTSPSGVAGELVKLYNRLTETERWMGKLTPAEKTRELVSRWKRIAPVTGEVLRKRGREEDGEKVAGQTERPVKRVRSTGSVEVVSLSAPSPSSASATTSTTIVAPAGAAPTASMTPPVKETISSSALPKLAPAKASKLATTTTITKKAPAPSIKKVKLTEPLTEKKSKPTGPLAPNDNKGNIKARGSTTTKKVVQKKVAAAAVAKGTGAPGRERKHAAEELWELGFSDEDERDGEETRITGRDTTSTSTMN